ncbi:hypothetical protein CK203_096116 [Vitis vinifera]|uniref:Retrotransposon Copia-like N-terminal domain-containing protein n=1 Tax=Vitis vinifera TaxID=29760 RepID=A0A438DVE8_VITVI|nr:hypothetical protein CK203_096116 [Vitis vinifera]
MSEAGHMFQGPQSPICKAIIHSGQVSLAISQSDHLSLWPSLIPAISPCSQSQGRKRFPVVESSSENIHRRRPFCQLFRRRLFLTPPTPQGAPGGDLQFFPKHGARKPPTRLHACFSGRRLHLTRVRGVKPLSGDALPPPPRLTPTSHPSYLFLPSEPCVPLLGSFASVGPLRTFFRRPPAIFSQPQSRQCLGKCSSTFLVVHLGFFFSIRPVSLIFSSSLFPATIFGCLPHLHDKIRNDIITSIQRHDTRIRGSSEIPNLGGSDSSPILITGHKLNGHNYLQWSQSVLLFICGKGKDEYLTGEAVMPETTEPGFRKWKIENSMIMSWLINSMNNDIGENFLLFGTAKDIWDAAKETYSSSENTSELFQVESAYMTSAKESSHNIQANCGTKETVQVFLGLNRELDDKESDDGIKEQPAPTLDASALAARSFNSSGGDRQKRDRPWCDYCKKPGHYKETCWKLHGKPADWKPKPRFDRDGRAHVAANSESTSVPEPSPFNKEQMEMLQKLLSQVGSGSTTGVAFTANRGGMSRG